MASFDRKSWRHWAGLFFLVSLLLAFSYARVIPERFFSWAPYDQHSRYTINVRIDGKLLPADDVAVRYGYAPRGWEVRAIHNVISLVRQYEMTYGRPDHATVTIDYVVNGRPPQTWTWPES